MTRDERAGLQDALSAIDRGDPHAAVRTIRSLLSFPDERPSSPGLADTVERCERVIRDSERLLAGTRR